MLGYVITMYNEITSSKGLTTNEECNISTLAHIFLLNTDKTKRLNTEIKIRHDAIKLRKRHIITSRYNNCVLIVLLSPAGLRMFSQQMTTWKHHFISQTCFLPSLLSESNADDQLCLMELIIIYLKFSSG
jgi:hypothetical protein